MTERLPALSRQPPGATFLGRLDCTAIGPDGEAHRRFLEEGRVALEPGLRFGAPGAGHVRLKFATSTGVLDLATAGMAKAVGA